ncbi:RNA-binding protein 7-like isoform X1 [Papaver somniferum]|uniref:RNA-binding protein 7-like isoform X1 n=1 Tax=Papaver somniferum TaxID=3469 RepID=UPI000E6FF3C6|nr:RNA-binding protein 7-like isoform X1 [Papaver somniferum]
MPGNRDCTVYVGNLDERVSERVLYDILIQAGRVVDLHIPRDRESNRPKGYAFAEYETEEIADYAVRLFTGLVTLYNRSLKFAISGQDKTTPLSSKPRPQPLIYSHSETRFSSFTASDIQQELTPPGVKQGNGYGLELSSKNYDISRQVLGAAEESIRRTNSSRKINGRISFQR